jgi:hypothetical protein
MLPGVQPSAASGCNLVMAATVEHAMPDTHPFADMLPAAVQLLRDEANLTTARHVLDDARQDCFNRVEEIESHKPAFGFLASKKQRDDYASSLASVQAQLQTIDAMIARVSQARERLQPSLRAAMADYLNSADPMYRQGLKASRFHERWRRAHSVVVDRLKGFLRDARELRSALSKDVGAARERYSRDAIWHLSNVRNAAVELDREMAALNEVAAEHHKYVASTPFSEIRLPIVERWMATDRIDSVTLKTPVNGMLELDRLLTEFTDLRQPSLATVHGIFEAAAGEHNQLAEARLRQCWSTLLAYAEAHLVSDAELEPTLRDIEARQAEAERARMFATAVRPFDHER